MRRATWMAVLALVLSPVFGCADNVTQVVVSMDAESAWRSAATEVRVVVRGAPAGDAGFDTPVRDVTLMVGAGQLYQFPVDVTVAPLEGDSTRRWSVDAIATNTETNATATVRVRGSYVSGRTLRVSLLFEDACAGVMCATDQTCRAGACVDATFNPEPLDAGTDAGTDAGVDLGVDGGVTDLGVTDEGMPTDGAIPLHCPSPTVWVPNSGAGTLDSDAGVVPYPVLATCPSNHQVGASCPGTPEPNDICYRTRFNGTTSYCRVPCTLQALDGGVSDDPICASVHPDSRCAPALGAGNEPDRTLCTIPCNPFDDVGCPAGLHCQAISDSDINAFYTECIALDVDPRHDHEPCLISNGDTYPTESGCAPGYTCGYDNVCSPSGPMGYVCLQICDPADVNPRVECPANTGCYRLANGTYDDAVGPLNIGRCGY